MKKGNALKRWRWLPLFLLLLLAGVWLLDRLDPLPLREVQPARVVVAEDGTPLWRFADKQGVWRYPVTLEEVSPDYIQALLTYEDRWFWHHPGINPMAIVRAIGQNLLHHGIVSGGSTLTMQVARLIDPQPRTLSGKMIQAWRALQLEWHLSKRDILTLYLNRAPFGGTVEGIGAASWMWLGKPPSQLTKGEAALLAVLPQAPSRLRPDRWPQRAEAARNKVLDRLAEYQVWSAQDVADIKQEAVWLPPRQTPQMAPLLARRLLSLSPDNKITSTLDVSLQRELESLASSLKNQLPPRTSLALLVVDHSNMKVRGYVGSVSFNDDSRFGHVDMISSVRSPGSVLKPFVYGMALDDGLIHGESLLQDVPRRFGDYRPGNFDSGFHGPVSASEALERSLNLPAVQLLDALGPKTVAARLRNVGLNLRFPAGAEPNLSLVLGGTGARLDDIVTAYSAFARQGNAAQLRWLPNQPLQERPLLSPGAAWIVRRILAGEALPSAAIPDIAPLAWKTGTSYGYRDAWTIGITPRYLIGVWVGRPDATPVAGQFGFASAVPVMNQVNNLLAGHMSVRGAPRDPRPDSVSAMSICWPGGQPLPLGDENCRQRRQSWILNQTVPPTLLAPGQEGVNGLRQRYWINPQGLRVAADCPNAQSQDRLMWPLPLEPWLLMAERREQRLPPIDPHCPPLNQNSAPPLLITGVINGQRVQPLPGKVVLMLPVTVQGGQGSQRWWFLNGQPIEQKAGQSSAALVLSEPGQYQLVVMDEAGKLASVSFIRG
ncbi:MULTISPECIES: peptidoglycan glycosyltransferase PbpC [unclassified Pantoea]|uniref:peptidoglycan glycosyltransferase PbpC n=1 Tax=unclassified Pantoea TaxID=2630326 RepID=UPI001CD6CEE3|nr:MULTISPECIES: peptidoglycan glycosyltransferase PbpC [unclassified Pantoea]MCA1175856.1 peptidoglycan glycosyltransferase PbpC [Pantoea sp. alder69]MCA1250688.1 peptidoglycan glycosyltransferase PbpC [Pantoea sp. alder70]MCA1265098.1 peptidoglycan glycosyltransferase PbpC [Pantoea sp. alder81]